MTTFVANTNVLDIVGLKNAIADTFINDATVTVTIKGPDGEDIDGDWPMTMDYVASSDGDYRAVLASELPLVANKNHLAIIDADGGAGLIGHWEKKFKPRVRTT